MYTCCTKQIITLIFHICCNIFTTILPYYLIKSLIFTNITDQHSPTTPSLTSSVPQSYPNIMLDNLCLFNQHGRLNVQKGCLKVYAPILWGSTPTRQKPTCRNAPNVIFTRNAESNLGFRVYFRVQLRVQFRVSFRVEYIWLTLGFSLG